VAQPRFVPEMIEADPALATRNREFRELFSSHFGRVRADNLPFERHIERVHRLDADDLDFCRQHGFFRMPIPRELGGAGRPKVDYYLLTTNAQRFADVAISLTIQANTSIGTTPILLARDTDLPKARKDIDGFLGDSAWQNEIQQRLEKLLGRLPSAGGERLKSAIEQMDKQLQQKIFRQSTLRVLLHRFARAWEQTLAAARAFDLPALQARMKEAVAEWKDACAKAQEVLHELDYRLSAFVLFLRCIAYGQI